MNSRKKQRILNSTDRNFRLVSLWRGLGYRSQTFVRAFPEFKEAVVRLYHDGYSSYRIEELTGISAGSVMCWVKGCRREEVMNQMRSDPHYRQVRDEVMKEMASIPIKHRQKRLSGKYLGGFHAQEHDLTDEWELPEPQKGTAGGVSE